MVKVHAENTKFIIIKNIKCLWLFRPIHVDNHGQWWSCLNIHKPQSGQWYTLKSLAILQVEQYFKKYSSFFIVAIIKLISDDSERSSFVFGKKDPGSINVVNKVSIKCSIKANENIINNARYILSKFFYEQIVNFQK